MDELKNDIFTNILAILDSLMKTSYKLNWRRLEPAFKDLIKVLQDEGYEEKEIVIKITEHMNLCDQQAKEFLKYCFRNSDQLTEDVFKDQENQYYNEEDLLRILEEENHTQTLEFGLDTDSPSRISKRFDSQSTNNASFSNSKQENSQSMKDTEKTEASHSQRDNSLETSTSSSKISKRLGGKSLKNVATSNLNQENKLSVKDNNERTKISQANDFDTSKNAESSGEFTETQNDTTLLESPQIEFRSTQSVRKERQINQEDFDTSKNAESSGGFTQTQHDTTLLESPQIEFPSTQSVIKELEINQDKGENIRRGKDNSTQRTENDQTNEKIFGGFGSFTQSQCFFTEETPQIEFPLTQNVIQELQINKEKQTKDQKNTYYTKKELLRILDDDNQSLTSQNNSSKSSKLFNSQSSNMTTSNSKQLSVKDQTNVHENSNVLTQDFGGFGTFTQSQSDTNVETPAIESTQNVVNEFEMNKKQNDENRTNMNEIINESHSLDSTSMDFIVYPI